MQPYNNKRVSSDSETQRAYAIPSDKILLNRFKNLKSWEYLIDDTEKAKLIFALVLSGEELIDNEEHRGELIKKYPTAAGGEMEGAGVYAACDGKAHCILIKGICDFADGQKGHNKSKNQQIAIESALSACLDLFSSKTAFAELGIAPIGEISVSSELAISEVNEILFEMYDANKETYYLPRDADGYFQKMMVHYGIWVYGISGCGKSSLIARNLIQTNSNFIQVNLASCVGLSVESFFTEILFEVASKIEGIHSQVQPKNFPECIRLLLNLLEKKYADKDLVILIEEIPLEDKASHQEFTQKMYSLLVSKALSSGLANVRIILSSINNPTDHIQVYNQKIHTQIKFIEMENWKDPAIISLFDLINKKLFIDIPKSVKDEIVAKSKGSPRFIKKFFRNVISLNMFDLPTLRQSLIETERELNQIQNG